MYYKSRGRYIIYGDILVLKVFSTATMFKVKPSFVQCSL